MNIGFDAKRAFHNNTGLGNYSRFVIQSLAEKDLSHDYYLYTPTLSREYQFEEKENIHVVTPQKSIGSSIWRSWTITKQLEEDNIDLYHGLSNELPFSIRNSDIKSVVTIHDLIFFRFPELYSYIDTKIYERKAKFACRHADKIIAVSEQTKNDIIRYLDVVPDKIEVVYQSCDNIFRKDASVKVLQRARINYHLPECYVLSVGTIEERKNLLLTVNAMLDLPKEVHLVVVGRKTKYFDKVNQFIREHNLANRIHFLENVPFADFPAIYKQASVFVYPSLFEGFGIPILEALYSKIPVIATESSGLAEVGGDKTCYVHPKESKKVANNILEIINNLSLRTEMIESGWQHAQRFNTEKITQRLLDIYSSIPNKL